MSTTTNRVWLVTGASAGFGRALGELILARGDRLVAAARDPATVAALVARAPERALAVRLDVTRQADIDAAVRAATERFGAIDVLVNNAGYGFAGTVEDGSDAEVRALFDVNFFGLAALTRAVLRGMRARRAGSVVNISSIAGVRGGPCSGYYAATKWAVEALSESLAIEAAPFGIRVLIVEPGAFRTDFAGRSLKRSARETEAYPAVPASREFMARMDGTQAGDPVRGSQAIIDAVVAADAPRRLVIGREAYDVTIRALEARLADTRRSAAIAPGCDFPDSAA
jgi:NAD(P)-dependent dehydrogenase (short-subunit alcohol dehydrogenase family)